MAPKPPESHLAPDPCRTASAFLPLIANSVSTSGFGYASEPWLTLYKGEFKGAFALCVVEDGEFLDQNFQRIEPLVVRQATPAYLRVTDHGVTGSSEDLVVQAFDEDNLELGTGVNVTVNRLGTSDTFTGPLTFYPDGDSAPNLRVALTGTLPSRSLPGGTSKVTAKKGSQEKARKPPKVPYKFKLEFSGPGNAAAPEQYTVVEDKVKNYAEKTYLLATVRNQHKNDALVSRFSGCAFIQELAISEQRPNLVFTGAANPGDRNPDDQNVAHGGDLLYSPDAPNPEGQPGFPIQFVNGKSQGRDGEGSFFVRAAARYRLLEADINTALSSFSSRLQVTTQCPTTATTLIDPSDPLTLGMWVDQVDYFPRFQGPQRHGNRAGAAKVSIDWIEKAAFDLFAAPTDDVDEHDSFRAPDLVLSDGETLPGNTHTTGDGPTIPYASGWTVPDAEFIIHIKANDVGGLRWGTSAEAQAGSPILTTPTQYPRAAFEFMCSADSSMYFECILSHEARHALQWRITADPAAGDTDRDTFAIGTIWDGSSHPSMARLIDQRNVRAGGSNPEFDLDPDVANQFTLRPARERDALRVQRHSTTLESLVLGATTISGLTIPRGLTTMRTVGSLQVANWVEGVADGLHGTVVAASVTGGPCLLERVAGFQTGTDVFSSIGPQVILPISAPNYASTCTIHITVVKPAGLLGADTEFAYDIPVQIP